MLKLLYYNIERMRILSPAAKIRPALTKLKSYWKTPPEGRYMNYKEIAAYSFGGIGVYSVITVINAMILSTTNTLIGNTIGIDPQTLYVLYLISVIISIPLTAIRANIVDNSRSRKGKYRPFIIKMGIPAVILSIGFVWMPYARMSMLGKCVTILLYNTGFQFFFNFYRDAYENLIYVLSPNSQERTDVLTFKSIVYSVAPTIINPLMPLLANVITNGNLNDLKLYRYAYPPIAVIGILLSMIAYAYTREKTLQARTHIVSIKFTDALREVARNKYFWIISLAGWMGFLEGASGTILYWLYQYTGACTPGMYAVIIFLYGDAPLWGMLATPFAVRKFGKKRILVFANLMNIILLAMLYPVAENIWLVLVIMYLNAFVGSTWVVLSPSIQADIRDYQHYVSGERIDGMFATVSLIGSIIGLVTSGVLPQIYAAGGIAIEKAQEMFNDPVMSSRVLPSGMTIAETIAERAAGLGVTPYEALNAYDALYNPDIFSSLIRVLILASVIGATLNVIPFFFYDLTEVKQQGIVCALKIRAFFEDYGNGLLSDSAFIETVDMIEEARENINLKPSDEAKKAYKKNKTKENKKAMKAEREKNTQIAIAPFIIKEIDKFKNGALDDALKRAHKIADAGLEGLKHYDPQMLINAKAMPKNTPEEKGLRKDAIRQAKLLKLSEKTIRKHFGEGLHEFDMEKYTSLYELEESQDLKEEKLFNDLNTAKKEKNKEKATRIKTEIKQNAKDKKETGKEIKKLSDKNAMYNRAAKPYLQALRLIKQNEDYSSFDDIKKQYNEVKARLAEKEKISVQ